MVIAKKSSVLVTLFEFYRIIKYTNFKKWDLKKELSISITDSW